LLDAASAAFWLGPKPGPGGYARALRNPSIPLHDMPLVSLADLPNELLADILEHPTFSTEALYFLGLQSTATSDCTANLPLSQWHRLGEKIRRDYSWDR
jgi:hypothetical protein